MVSAEGDTLLDSGEITDLQENDGKIAFDYQASAIMEKGKEYFLTFNMSTDKHKNLALLHKGYANRCRCS